MTWWLLKPLGEFLSGFRSHLSILRLDYTGFRCRLEVMHTAAIFINNNVSMYFKRVNKCPELQYIQSPYLKKQTLKTQNIFGCSSKHLSVFLVLVYTDYMRHCGPALLPLPCGVVDVFDDPQDLDKTNLSSFICVGGSPLKALLQDWRSPISTISFWQAAGGVTWSLLCTDATWQASRSVMSAITGGKVSACCRVKWSYSPVMKQF